MSTLLVAIGNTLRRDDGVAHRVLDLLEPPPAGTTTRRLHQLTPEVAEEMAHFARVVFVDASVEATGEPALEAVPVRPAASSLSHDAMPAAVVALSRRLYGFGGEAWVLGVPVSDVGLGESLSEEAKRAARRTAETLRAFLESHSD